MKLEGLKSSLNLGVHNFTITIFERLDFILIYQENAVVRDHESILIINSMRPKMGVIFQAKMIK